MRVTEPLSLRLVGTFSSQVQQVAQGYFWLIFSISRDGDYTSSLDNLFQCLITLTAEIFFLLVVKWNVFYFGLCPLPLLPSLDITEKELLYSLPLGI